jgi:hypothetical protein
MALASTLSRAGNAAPDFNSSTRPGAQLYSNHMVAINVTNNGTIVWATPFIYPNTSLNVSAAIPDVHDIDLAWGSIIREVDFGQGPQKIVIGHDKYTNIVAMNASTGYQESLSSFISSLSTPSVLQVR